VDKCCAKEIYCFESSVCLLLLSGPEAPLCLITASLSTTFDPAWIVGEWAPVRGPCFLLLLLVGADKEIKRGGGVKSGVPLRMNFLPQIVDPES